MTGLTLSIRAPGMPAGASQSMLLFGTEKGCSGRGLYSFGGDMPGG
ncbi:hypothetical protein [Nocardia niwae]|nr:hypothetical protein [Nocardia niwae]